MENNKLTLENKLFELKSAFDRSFEDQKSVTSSQTDRFLSLRVGNDDIAFRLNEINSIETEKKIVPLQAPIRTLLGIAGVRGKVVPVFSLDEILGQEDGLVESVRQLILCGKDEVVGLAFTGGVKYFHIPKADFSPMDVADNLKSYAEGIVRFESRVNYVLSIPSILKHIKANAFVLGTGGRQLGEG